MQKRYRTYNDAHAFSSGWAWSWGLPYLWIWWLAFWTQNSYLWLLLMLHSRYFCVVSSNEKWHFTHAHLLPSNQATYHSTERHACHAWPEDFSVNWCYCYSSDIECWICQWLFLSCRKTHLVDLNETVTWACKLPRAQNGEKYYNAVFFMVCSLSF